ncbi:pyridoxal phosphate-dependent aminotransferase [Leptospira koniambonensis]|uniref:Pyridoxal phosphate-dependent aminotransferase n=1 Tax=Leptospira koniambonensis TaxID=2484950 RepID=A0A4R9J8E3_9LEPT|nr:pyridoxal phosphate-dependent aminotransferase [Leptospira koniambonensis]TGL34518.1 pyridoxal phosphate-dependent aminotransferase [Leptospira koniambonensis]
MDQGNIPRFSDRFEFVPGENDLYSLLESFKKSGEDWIDLTISNPTKVGLVYPREAILHSLEKPESLEYDPDPKGTLIARKSIAGYYKEKGHTISEEDLFLTSSSSEAYSYLIKLLCNPGEEVLIPSPGYPLFEFLSLLDGAEFNSYKLDQNENWKIDFEDLNSKITHKTKILFLVSPNNPTGNLLTGSEFEKLKAISKTKGIALVLDEVFSDYLHKENLHQIDFFHTDIPVFVVNGVSKILALPQMKLSWIHVGGPTSWKKECKERLEIIADTYLSVGTPIQLALHELFQWRNMIQSQVLRRINRNLQVLESYYSSHPGITYTSPKGGWYAVLQSPSFLNDEEFSFRLLEKEKVLVHPGSMFGFEEASGYIVISLISETELFQSGLERISALL